jgi:hypothetical protein
VPDPAWQNFSLSIGDWLCVIAVTLVLAVLVVVAVESFGARAGARGLAVSRQGRLPLISGLDPGPGSTQARNCRTFQPGRERPWDWATDGEAISAHSPGPREPMLGREEKCPKIGTPA